MLPISPLFRVGASVVNGIKHGMEKKPEIDYKMEKYLSKYPKSMRNQKIIDYKKRQKLLDNLDNGFGCVTGLIIIGLIIWGIIALFTHAWDTSYYNEHTPY